MSDILAFVSAVFDTWVTYVGIALTVIPFIEKIPFVKKRLHGEPILDRFRALLWIIGILCVVGGFYHAWKEQKDKAEAVNQQFGSLQKEFADKDVPNLSLQIDGLAVADGAMAVGPKGQKAAIKRGVVFMTVNALNHGADSTLDHYKLNITTPLGKHYDDLLPALYGNKGSFTMLPLAERISYEDLIWKKTFENPVQRGRKVRGVIQFFLPENIPASDVRVKGTVFELTATDIDNKVVKVQQAWERPGGMLSGSLPGLTPLPPAEPPYPSFPSH